MESMRRRARLAVLVTAAGCGPTVQASVDESSSSVAVASDSSGIGTSTTTTGALETTGDTSSSTGAPASEPRCTEVAWIDFGDSEGHTFVGAAGAGATAGLLFHAGFDIPDPRAVVLGSDTTGGPWSVIQTFSDGPRAAVDIDGDGVGDVVVHGLGQALWWQGDRDGGFLERGAVDLQQGDGFVAIPGDDRIGRLHLGTRLDVDRGDGAGGFTLAAWSAFPEGYDAMGQVVEVGPATLAIELRYLDCIGLCGGTWWIVVVEETVAIEEIAIVDQDIPIDVRDHDGDGDLDWLTIRSEALHLQHGGEPEPTIVDPEVNEVAAGDLDGDGGIDVVASNTDGLFVRFGDAGEFGDARPIELTRIEPALLVLAAPIDLDHDGADEIVVGEGGQGDDVAVIRTVACPP